MAMVLNDCWEAEHRRSAMFDQSWHLANSPAEAARIGVVVNWEECDRSLLRLPTSPSRQGPHRGTGYWEVDPIVSKANVGQGSPRLISVRYVVGNRL